jgi:hypothetical protein
MVLAGKASILGQLMQSTKVPQLKYRRIVLPTVRWAWDSVGKLYQVISILQRTFDIGPQGSKHRFYGSSQILGGYNLTCHAGVNFTVVFVLTCGRKSLWL